MTILATPGNYSSIHGDLVYTVYDAHSEDAVSYPNYKYIADIYIDGDLIARIRKQQDPTTGIGIFNIGQIVRNYISTTFNPEPSVLLSQLIGEGGFYLPVLVTFGEEYNFTSYYDLANDSIRKFYNHYNGRLVGATTAISSKIAKLATNNSLSGSLLLTSSFYFVPYMATTGAGTISVNVTPYGGGSAFSTSFLWIGDGMHVLNISPVVLNTLHSGAITSATKYYTVQIGSQTYRVNVECEPKYESYMIHFLNQYGGFESKLFSKVSRRKYKVDRKDFGKLNYTVDDSGNVNYRNDNGVYNEGKSVYSAQFEEKLTLNTDLLTDAEYTWLRDLIISPMVYIQDGEYFFPVVIEENDYEPKKTVNDDLTNLTITISYGQNLNGQYR